MSETPQNPAPEPEPTQPDPATSQTWGAPPTSTPRWTWRKTVIAAAVAVGIAGAGGAAVWAASTAAGEHTNGAGGPVFRVAGGPVGSGGMPIHGESVVKDEDGEFFTQLTQTGEVTALSDTSMTARSEDGYTKTYVITDDTTLESVEVGDEVMVIARLEADTATADTVFDTSEMMKGGPGPGAGKGGGDPADRHRGDHPDRGDR